MEISSGFNLSNEPIELPPGFRFHPTDEELITHYLSPKVLNPDFTTTIVGDVDLNKVEPWDLPCKLYNLFISIGQTIEHASHFTPFLTTNLCLLARDQLLTLLNETGIAPHLFRNIHTDLKTCFEKIEGKAKMGEKEWYFFCVKDRKYPTGSRTNRATEAGYWKATGKDKEIYRAKTLVGMKKTLVFYRGRAPRGEKTNWVMHEYRLEGKKLSIHSNNNSSKTAKNEWVICRIFKKSSGGKKVHISGLMRNRDCGSNLPPLTDISCDEENQTMIGEGSQVTCFSNPIENARDRSFDEFSSSSKTGDFAFVFNQYHSRDVDCEVGFKPYVDDHDFQIGSTGHVDFDCLWDY